MTEFYVDVYFRVVHKRGTAHEYTEISRPETSGPFETRATAEQFARGMASQPGIAKIKIRPEE